MTDDRGRWPQLTAMGFIFCASVSAWALIYGAVAWAVEALR